MLLFATLRVFDAFLDKVVYSARGLSIYEGRVEENVVNWTEVEKRFATA